MSIEKKKLTVVSLQNQFKDNNLLVSIKLLDHALFKCQ